VDFLRDRLRVSQNVSGSEAHDFEAFRFQPVRFRLISQRNIRGVVGAAVDFDDKLRRKAHEVCDVRADWGLAAEVERVTASESAPQRALARCRACSQ
jgi:hypothetical protein